MIAPLGLEHVEAVARLHCASLTGLLSRLGLPAAKAYYTGSLRCGAAIGFVGLQEGALQGFVLGALEPQRLNQGALRANLVPTIGAIGLGVLRRPSSFVWLARSLRGPDQGGYDQSAPELKYLAVRPESRGTGLGRSLVDAFSGAVADAGMPAFELSVDDDNQGAISFYEALGFRLVGRYREFGALHRRYRRESGLRTGPGQGAAP